MANIFNAIKLLESQEDPYVMKCIMRVVGLVDFSRDLEIGFLTGLTSILNEVCKNPKNPIFNDYLFELVSTLMRTSCERDPGLIASFEANLFPILQTILVHDVMEFVPYSLQLLAQLIEINQPPLPIIYMQIFQRFLFPKSWEKFHTLNTNKTSCRIHLYNILAFLAPVAIPTGLCIVIIYAIQSKPNILAADVFPVPLGP